MLLHVSFVNVLSSLLSYLIFKVAGCPGFEYHRGWDKSRETEKQGKILPSMSPQDLPFSLCLDEVLVRCY